MPDRPTLVRDGEPIIGRARSLRRVVRWPGLEVEVALAVLSRAEAAEAATAATLALRARGLEGDDIPPGEASVQIMLETLAIALREPGPDGARIYAAGVDLAADADERELATLWVAYQDLRLEVAPDLGDLGDDDLDQLAKVIGRRRAAAWRFRFRYAVTLQAFYGRPAIELTDLEVWACWKALEGKPAAGRGSTTGGRRVVTKSTTLEDPDE